MEREDLEQWENDFPNNRLNRKVNEVYSIWVDSCLESKFRKIDDGAPLLGRLVGAYADTGPVC